MHGTRRITGNASYVMATPCQLDDMLCETADMLYIARHPIHVWCLRPNAPLNVTPLRCDIEGLLAVTAVKSYVDPTASSITARRKRSRSSRRSWRSTRPSIYLTVLLLSVGASHPKVPSLNSFAEVSPGSSLRPIREASRDFRGRDPSECLSLSGEFPPCTGAPSNLFEPRILDGADPYPGVFIVTSTACGKALS